MRSRTKSDTLFVRSSKVIPGGIYGHLSPSASLPRHFAHFCSKGEGVHFEDVDGNDWLDFMCAYGAVLHGYNHPEIEKAVAIQRKLGTVFNHPHEVSVELAEKLTDLIDFADWAVFAKNGSDLTTWAIRVARERTQRPIVIKARGAYHGVDAWCDPGMGGRIESDRADIKEFDWNNLNELEDLFKKFKDQVAAVILTPYHHASFAPSVLPDENFWTGVRKLCNDNDSILVLDDVRAGWRIHEKGSHCFFGFEPDLAVYSKALGNGYAISACVGIDSLKSAASDVFLTGSCWNDAVAMRAALTSISIAERDGVVNSVCRKGKYLCDSIEAVAKKYGYNFKMTGPPSMPYPWFFEDDDLYKIQEFCKIASNKGLFFHPHHNWFISNAHDKNSLESALTLVTETFHDMANGK